MQTEVDFHAAVGRLTARDRHLRDLVESVGRPSFWFRTPEFPTLVLFILEQQVSLASAAATLSRLEARIGAVTPQAIRRAGPEVIRSAGVTRQKTRYLVGIADRVVAGQLDLAGLSGLDDDSVRAQLTASVGIGPWTADVWLLSCLRRPDIWPIGDRALQVGAAEALDLPETPDASGLEALGRRWRPDRSTAARLLWHRYLAVRNRPT